MKVADVAAAVETNLAVPAAAQPAWAPRLGRMAVWTTLMAVVPNAGAFVMRLTAERPSPASMVMVAACMVVAMVGSAVLAPSDYRVARAACARDPTLRGQWFVENAGWVIALAVFLGSPALILLVA